MPYVEECLRPPLDKHTDALAGEINRIADDYTADGAFAGLLNYSITRLCLKVAPARKYWVIATITGVLENVKQEFYRRYAAPYEEEQIVKNGDVY